MYRKTPAFLRALAALLSAALLCAAPSALADSDRLPHVTASMTQADFWADRTAQPDAVLADAPQIEALNAAFLSCPECYMVNLQKFYPTFDGNVFRRQLLKGAMKDLSTYLDEGYFMADAQPLLYGDMAKVFEAIDGADTSDRQRVRYGICVERADVRAVPTDMLVTDSAGDNDYDVLQMSALRVNEPVVIRARTADGAWFYCDSVCVSGWVPAERIAVCADRREWWTAQRYPAEDALVVTAGKLYLDAANVNAAASQRMLTMGTVLRRVPEDAYDPAVTNRAAYHNYAVYLPVRNDDGSYAETIALIPRREGVHEGYMPLTARNVLNTAFSMLGDAYGWGGMLDATDCSLYIRNIYKCFGLELPRNTVWQSAMPAMKYDLSDMDAEQKAALLDELPPCAILFFKGHEMLYLGRALGRHYVLSSVSSIMRPGGEGRLRVRNVIVNALEETKRMNGNTWLEDLNLAAIPWQPAEAAETENAA